MKLLFKSFDGWYLITDESVREIPWMLMSTYFIFYIVLMIVITKMCQSNSLIENAISKGVRYSDESMLKMVLVGFSIIMSLNRVMEIDMPLGGTLFFIFSLIVVIISLTVLVLLGLRKIKQKLIPLVYALNVILIFLIPTVYFFTPIFIVPVVLAIITGYLIGKYLIDKNIKLTFRIQKEE
jgi:predicted ferric reductase